jgi:uncharacterized phosphosugar-binding protein
MLGNIYAKNIFEVISKIEKCEEEKIKKAAEIAEQVIKNDGIIYVFGCGHSHLVGLDSFYRAGGLANVSAVLDTDLMLHNGAAKSSRMEKMEEISPEIFRRYCISEKDCIFVISSSGKNGAPVEMALCAKRAGVPSIAITSMEYKNEKSKHSSGKRLFEAADMFIDCHVPHGDATVSVGKKMMGSVSTIAGTFILQSVLMEAAANCEKENIDASVYRSGNIEGGGEYNKTLIDTYLKRVKHL